MKYGFLNIYKPKGITSFDVIFKLRKILQIKKMGHTGTLDPMAEGVLIVALSEATKIIEFMMQHDKAYSAEIILGSESTTYDAEGELKKVGSQKPDFDEVQAVIESFEGEVDQVPPIYSALKINGKKAYELAREGKKVEMKSRKVTIHDIVLIDYKYPNLTIDVECSSGTYIRSLAHDIGKKLETGAYLNALKRTKVGHFLVEDSVKLEDLEEDGLDKHLIPIEALSINFPSLEISRNELNKLNLGQFIEREDIKEENVCAFHEKKLVGILEKVKDTDKPLYKYKKKINT
ncbi:tRNA pseudouridine(55) synthase TruB [Patescibacteria group bacterium]